MSEHRVRDDDDFAGQLIREGLSDAPRREAAAKIAAGLALGSFASASAASTAAHAAASSAGLLATAAPGSAVSSLTAVSLLKSFGVGALMGTVVLGVVSAAVSETTSQSDDRFSEADHPPSPSEPARPVAGKAQRDEPHGAAAEANVAVSSGAIAPSTPEATPLPTSTASVNATAGRARRTALVHEREAAAAAPSAFAADAVEPATGSQQVSLLSVTQEVTLVDRVRAALSGGRPIEALRLLDEHQSRMKTLWVEAQVLRVEALARAGNRAAARAVGEQFIRTYPGTAHAARVRELLQGP